MKIFNLPDLGEGLPDAEINEWYVKEGDTVTQDQPMVSVETAKAVVDVPAPFPGTISKLHGAAGDIIKTGSPLVSFEGEGSATEEKTEDAGTVVGNIPSEDTVLRESPTGITRSANPPAQRASTTQATSIDIDRRIIPEVRALARRLNVNVNSLTGSGYNGMVTVDDVSQAAVKVKAASSNTPAIPGAEPLRGVRRTMASSMSQSHKEIVPVTLVDDADIHAWAKGTDITLRVMRAIQHACQVEPALNALYDGQAVAVKRESEVNLGLAMDSEDGLFVPVLKDLAKQSDADLRQLIERYKEEVKSRTIAPEDLQGHSISLSNFGMFAGRYANPIIVPPTVAIVGVGRLREQVVLSADGKAENHRIMPLSLTFDHRAATGGEASRFLGALIEALSKA